MSRILLHVAHIFISKTAVAKCINRRMYVMTVTWRGSQRCEQVRFSPHKKVIVVQTRQWSPKWEVLYNTFAAIFVLGGDTFNSTCVWKRDKPRRKWLYQCMNRGLLEDRTPCIVRRTRVVLCTGALGLRTCAHGLPRPCLILGPARPNSWLSGHVM